MKLKFVPSKAVFLGSKWGGTGAGAAAVGGIVLVLTFKIST